MRKLAIVLLVLAAVIVGYAAQLDRPCAADGECVWVCVTVTPTATNTPTVTNTPPPTATPTQTATATPIVTKKGLVFTGPGDVELGAQWLDDFQASWWYNYNPALGQDRAGYVPMIHAWTDAYWVAAATSGMPAGSYYLIFNEPDRADQDNLTAAQAASEYYRIRGIILGIDATAKFVFGNLQNIETSGYRNSASYLLSVRASYLSQYGVAMPADAYGGHHYLCGGDYTSYTYRMKVQLWRQWMAAQGLAGQFWLTETGCLTNSATAALIMSENLSWLKTTTYLDRFSWFTSYWTGGSGSLLNANGSMTSLGTAYAQ